MKISELIKHLEKINQTAQNDCEIRFVVKDYYTNYAHEMDCFINTESWFGYVIAGGVVTLNGFFLKESEGKKPKVTFR